MAGKSRERNDVERFLKSVLFIALVCALVLAPLELLLRRNILFYDRIKHQSDSVFALRQTSVEWLFLGHSQILYGIDPEAIPTGEVVHNLAFADEPIATTYFKLKHYLAKGRLPELKRAWIAFDMSQLTPGEREGLRFEYNYTDVYNDLLLNDGEFRQSTTVNDWARVLLYNAYVVRSRTNLVHIVSESRSKEDSITAHGFGSRRSAMRRQDSAAIAATYWRDATRTPRVLSEGNIFWYNKLIGMLRARGVEVVLIRMPLVCDRADTIAMHREHQRLVSVVRNNFAAVRFINCALPEMGLSHSDFCDPAHLNAAGARKVSARLVHYAQ